MLLGGAGAHTHGWEEAGWMHEATDGDGRADPLRGWSREKGLSPVPFSASDRAAPAFGWHRQLTVVKPEKRRGNEWHLAPGFRSNAQMQHSQGLRAGALEPACLSLNAGSGQDA